MAEKKVRDRKPSVDLPFYLGSGFRIGTLEDKGGLVEFTNIRYNK